MFRGFIVVGGGGQDQVALRLFILDLNYTFLRLRICEINKESISK